MPTYRIETPEGKVFEIESDTPPTDEEVDEVSAGPRDAQIAPDDSSLNWGGMAAVGAGLGIAGSMLAKRPGLLGTAAKAVNTVRQQMMLTGFALPKSILGNMGAAGAMALEEKSMKPLGELFSTQTLKDALGAYKQNSGVGPLAGGHFPGPNPGRIMGMFDVATQNALQRAGMTAEESAAAVFQTPLGQNHPKLAPILESPAAKYMFPFRRTPWNQFTEGMKTLAPDFEHSGIRNAYVGAGAAHGYATSDEQYPLSLPLATAGAARYGLPYAGGALMGRALGGGKTDAGAAGSMLPMSEYGVTQSLQNPTNTFTDPPFMRALKRLFGE